MSTNQNKNGNVNTDARPPRFQEGVEEQPRTAPDSEGWFNRFSRNAHSSFVEYFQFLPIRFKLGLLIVSIVMSVLIVFSIVVIHSQKTALMQRMTQVCNVLIRNLSESVKGDLLFDQDEQVIEQVLRLKNTSIEGLRKVAVINRNAEVVAGFDAEGDVVEIPNPKDLLKYRELTVVEFEHSFNYYHPIVTELKGKDIVLGVAFVSFSKQAILAPITKARRLALAFASLITAIAIIGINVISKKVTKQIQLLSDGARQVGQGNLGVQIQVSSKDELGMLAHEFNNMLQHLREKLHMQKFVSKLTVDMIRDSVRADTGRPLAIKHEVTVLFSDVRNFSSIAEQLDPSEIVKLINIYFDLQTRIIESHNGVVDKFMGDQIMAIFQGPSMADDVLRAAVEVQRQIRMVNQKRMAADKITLEMGVGINSGSAVLGNMGSSNRMDYTVIGDVVNVAARLCAAAKSGQIITSYNVAKSVNGSYPTSRLKSISVKGRMQEIEVCEVDYDRDILT